MTGKKTTGASGFPYPDTLSVSFLCYPVTSRYDPPARLGLPTAEGSARPKIEGHAPFLWGKQSRRFVWGISLPSGSAVPMKLCPNGHHWMIQKHSRLPPLHMPFSFLGWQTGATPDGGCFW